MRVKIRIAALVLTFGLFPAASGLRAQDAHYDPVGELDGLKKYGATHAACDGWADGCALCARRSDGSLGCSRMGVECEITPIVCTQKARDPKTGKTPPPQ